MLTCLLKEVMRLHIFLAIFTVVVSTAAAGKLVAGTKKNYYDCGLAFSFFFIMLGVQVVEATIQDSTYAVEGALV